VSGTPTGWPQKFEGWAGGSKPPEYDEEYQRSFEWNASGRLPGGTKSMTISVPVDLYEYCSGRSRSRVFGTYVCDPIQRPFLDSLLKSIDDTVGGTEPGSDEEFDAVVRFVQSLKYSRDTDDTGHLEYPKYPVETLVHRQGDCEDGTILMGALLRRLGYDVVVVSLPDHAHMVLGVALDDAPGDSITHEGAEYSVVETTSTGWEVGQVPPRVSG